MSEEYPLCPERRGRFFNPHLKEELRGFFDFILWKIGRYDDEEVIEPPPEMFSYPSLPKPYDRSAPTAVWIGHSTYLIDTKEWVFLTDPVWGRYCSPVPFQSLERKNNPPFPMEALPRLNAILISHNHYDHLDARAIKILAHLQPDLQWFVPKRLSPWFQRRGISCHELDWWQTWEGEGHRITAVPSQHFSGRTLFDKNKTLWNGYVVETLKTGKRFYFVGDTGYNPFDFKRIGKRFSRFDLSLIPIGTYIPKRFMSPVHCSPYEAVEIHCDVNSQLSLGMHWNTFCLSDEPFDRPPYDLYLAMKEKNLSFDTFLPIDIGVHVNW
jgi:N-acyl-phosphatidylethanolamine-hydrolysing phospholipase D